MAIVIIWEDVVDSHYVPRNLELSPLLKNHSLLLLGPRQTGKSSFLREQLTEKPALYYDLLDQGLALSFLSDPTSMRKEIEHHNLGDCLVVIDEIQKVPALLDEAQLLIESRGIRFLMTGPSARKLKAAGTNLLGGRARTRSFHPFCYPEVKNLDFSLERAMNQGLLPPHYLSPSPDEDLAAYVGTYLKEEIAAEGRARKLQDFARFLQVAAACNTKMLNFSKVASDAQVPRQTVEQWYQILIDTLLGYQLAPYARTVKRKAIATPKFYLFDMGVVKTLKRLKDIAPPSTDFGDFFEHFIFLELRAYLDYRRPQGTVEYWRSTSGFEVDFVLDGEVAIEVKAAERVNERDAAGLRALKEEGKLRRCILVCRESRPQMLKGGIEALPWREFLELLWSDSLFSEGPMKKEVALAVLDPAIAHRRESDGETQSVTEHLLGVAKLASEYAGDLGLQNSGELLGLLHDIGKWSKAFQQYIASATGLIDEDEDDYVSTAGLKGKIDHSTAGAQYIARSTAAKDKATAYAGEVLALCLASHHSGLIDAFAPDGEDILSARLEKVDEKTHYEEVISKIPKPIETRIRQLVEAPDTWRAFGDQIKLISKTTPYLSSLHFTVGLLVKFLFSCLIDADRQDTADFQEPERASLKNDGQYAEWEDLERRLEARLDEYIARNDIDAIRGHISATCLAAGDRDKGIFLLTVPTGGGKTLASLRFALRHARKHGMRRIVYVIPFTSIIDQNADSVRAILESAKYGVEQYGKVVLEHHSNLTPDEETARQKVLAENWDAPIVFTTSVQFLETLFGHGTRGIRRLHQLANAVIIFDEIQTLPIRCVHLFNNAINFLAQECGSTAVMCTATQPLLGDVDPKRGALHLSPDAELMPDVRSLFADLKRVEVAYEHRDVGWSIFDVAQRAIEEQKESGSALVVVNTKRSAKELYSELKRNTETEVLHLSTNMCPAHRLRILRHIRWLLKRGRPVICVSTQLIEAGIDIDFGSVIRFVAGLDSIAQAAGRCNRNGYRPMGRVIVVNPAEENLTWLPDISIGIECTERVMREFDKRRSVFDNDRIGPKAMKRYYELYFFERSASMAYPVGKNSPVGRDDDLLSLLADNGVSRQTYQLAHDGKAPATLLMQSFMSASKAFEAIDSNTRGVIVPYREGKDIINDLFSTDNIHQREELLKKAQRYSVNVFEWQRKALIQAGAVHEVGQTGVLCMNPGYYDMEYGMNEKGDGKLGLLNC